MAAQEQGKESGGMTDVPTVIGECMGYVMLRKNGEAILYAPDGEVVTRAEIHYDPDYLKVLGYMFGTLAACHKWESEK